MGSAWAGSSWDSVGLSWAETSAALKHTGALWLLGLMQRTNVGLVLLSVLISSVSCSRNLADTEMCCDAFALPVTEQASEQMGTCARG
jgi:hypothetical protein